MIKDIFKKILQFFQRQALCLERGLDMLLSRLKALDIPRMNAAEYNQLILEVESYFRRVKEYKKEVGVDSTYLRLMAKAVSAKLGGKIPFTLLLDPAFANFAQFIEANALHHKMQTLKLVMNLDEAGSPLIQVFMREKRSYFIPWDSLSIVPVQGGFSFRYFNVEVFRTNLRYKLTHDYILTFKGITEYHPHHNDEIIPFDKRDPNEWNCHYIVEIWTLIADGREDRPTIGIGDHCHIMLKDADGFVYSMGKFGAGTKFKIKDYLTLFGPKPGRFICPDFICYYSETTRNLKKKQIIITKEEFDKLYSLLSLHRKNKTPTFTLLKNNCASYVESVLSSGLGISVDAKMFLPHFVLRAFISKESYRKVMRALAPVVKRAPKWLYFIPIVYIPLVCLSLAIVSLGGGLDYPIRDIFLKPWKLTIDHPIALREGLEKISRL